MLTATGGQPSSLNNMQGSNRGKITLRPARKPRATIVVKARLISITSDIWKLPGQPLLCTGCQSTCQSLHLCMASAVASHYLHDFFILAISYSSYNSALGVASRSFHFVDKYIWYILCFGKTFLNESLWFVEYICHLPLFRYSLW